MMSIGLSTVGCQSTSHLEAGVPPLQVAFMPDIHFHDIYADFNDGSFAGLATNSSGKHATIRSMSAQLNSTRLFNENYFALLAALDDIVARGVKLVALPGDFSDDGQTVHMRGLRKILDRYAKQHGLAFFAAPGNHDPKRPYSRPAGKGDYLGHDGHNQRIFSQGMAECKGYQTPWATVDAGYALSTICSEEVKELGYQGVMRQLAQHGFYPQPHYRYWETPFSQYDSKSYQFEEAVSQASYANRQYEICHQGSGGRYKQSGYSHCLNVPDSSYLVEPVDGLWLLAIDANVYVPNKAGAGAASATSHLNFSGSGNAGYNKMFSHKAHVMAWIKSVVQRANAAGKTLIAFSHFPMVEFYDQQSNAIAKMFGAKNFQLARRPNEAVSHALAAMGLKVHVGGHMHINDTGIQRNQDGNFLFNIQAPSVAAYVPAYKIMTLKGDSEIDVETVILDKIPRFTELFEHYHKEHQRLQHQGSDKLWNKEILNARSYDEFTQWHIRELTRQRFLPQEWPAELRELLFTVNGQDMLVLSQLMSPVTLKQLINNEFSLAQLRKTNEWKTARQQANKLARLANLALVEFAQWNGFDLAVDFYRLRNADQLALRDISQQRLAQYRFFARTLDDEQQVSVFSKHFGGLFKILDGFQKGLPSQHFRLNTSSGTITDLNH